jgi:hypothetical protein
LAIVGAVDEAAALRVKKEVGLQLKILGQVKVLGVDKWFRALQLVAHNGGWPANLTSLDGVQLAQDAETREHEEMRKSPFTLVFQTIEGKEELLENVALGDGNGALLAIYRSYHRNTTSGYHRATQNFYDCTMEKEAVHITGFAALIAQRARHFEAQGGQPGEKDKITVLLGGLLPEFKDCKAQLKMKTLATTADATTGLTFKQAVLELHDYAVEEGYEELNKGGSSAKAATFSLTSVSGNAQPWQAGLAPAGQVWRGRQEDGRRSGLLLMAE